MNCPTCRHDNEKTTRFCTSCGAVLVENMLDGSRRRVLRPWGLAADAPITIAPDPGEMPEIDAALRAHRSRSASTRRAPVVVGSVIAALAGMFLFAYARGVERTPIALPSTVVETTLHHAALERLVVSPPLIEPLPAPRLAQPSQRRETRDRNLTPAPAVDLAPAEPIVRDTPVVAAEVPPSAPAPPPDRGRLLEDALARCAGLGNVFQRAACENGARNAHCEERWGQVALCPATGTESSQ
ncbi:MAG TPA: zinc ribbon domain-containing protein [Casimicrobiaceae bacterium]|nr:zinc ribbon domain-containing protein [Casimicrobiaceae bacterium]